jgi:integrase
MFTPPRKQPPRKEGRTVAHIERYRTSVGEKRYRVRWEATNGRTKSKSFALAKDAQRYKLEQERRASLGELYEAEPETFGEFLEPWKSRYRQKVRRSTYDRVSDALHHLEPFESIRLDKLTPGEVEDRFLSVAEKAPRQAQIGLQTFLKILRNASSRGHRINPALFDLKPPRMESKEMRFLTWAEVELLASHANDPYGNLIQLAALTGLRQGELFALKDANLDLEARTITVTNGVYRGELVPLKTAASRRRVDLSQQAATILKKQLLARKPSPMGLVFPSPDGKLIDANNFRHRVYKKARDRAGFSDLRFHDLRHTYAALMVAAGAHAKYLQAQMGHSSIKVTLDRYGHLYPDANRAVLSALDALTNHISDPIETPSVKEAF